MTSSYADLVNVPSFGKKRENFDPDRGGLVHYCRDCQKETPVECLDEEKAVYICTVCQGRNIATGSAASIAEFYHKRR